MQIVIYQWQCITDLKVLISWQWTSPNMSSLHVHQTSTCPNHTKDFFGGVLFPGDAQAHHTYIWSVCWTSFSIVSMFFKKKTNRQFCFVLFSLDRRFPKYVKTYSISIFNSSVLYVFRFLGKCLSKENKIKQNWLHLFWL